MSPKLQGFYNTDVYKNLNEMNLSKEEKTIFFIRHGESEYNHWREKSC